MHIDDGGVWAGGWAVRDMHVYGVRLLVARAKHSFRDVLKSSPNTFHQLGGDKVRRGGGHRRG